MRSLFKLALLAACACLSTATVAGPSIRVQAGDWGAASVQDIEAVLDSVAEVLLPDFPQHASVRIVVRRTAGGPRVLADKTADGAHQVLLDVRDARWDQFAYQFSHELCHIVSNYDHREIADASALRPHQWFEETLCEMVSLVTLDRLASAWQRSAPHSGWESYAPAFRRYADRLRQAGHRRLSTSFAAWYRANGTDLERDPYLRDRNEFAASAMLELFQSTPDSLRAIGYLNLAAPSRERFADYLAAWYDCCPEAHRPLVQRLMALFAAA